MVGESPQSPNSSVTLTLPVSSTWMIWNCAGQAVPPSLTVMTMISPELYVRNCATKPALMLPSMS